MNPGAVSLLIMMIFVVLFATGWGARYITESRMKEGKWLMLLVLVGIAGSLDMQWQSIQINMAFGLYSLLLTLYLYWILGWRERVYFVVSVITISSLIFILMTVVPHDPAFYLMDGKYLYPVGALLVAYTFSRKPLFTYMAAATGILLAGTIHEYRTSFELSGTFLLGSPDLFDLVSIAFMLGFLIDQLVYLVELAMGRMNRIPKRNLKGDPT